MISAMDPEELRSMYEEVVAFAARNLGVETTSSGESGDPAGLHADTRARAGDLLRSQDYVLIGSFDAVPVVDRVLTGVSIAEVQRSTAGGYAGEADALWDNQVDLRTPDGRQLFVVGVGGEDVLVVPHDDAGTVQVVPWPDLVARFPATAADAPRGGQP